MSVIQKFEYQTIQTVSQIIGDIIKGKDIDEMFKQLHLSDNSGHSTKWRRLAFVLSETQLQYACGNKVIEVIQYVFHPTASWFNGDYYNRISDINKCISFYGMELKDDGKIHLSKSSTTKKEVDERYDLLRSKLLERNIHQSIFKFCTKDILEKDYHSIILESAKSVYVKLRDITLINEDGNTLVRSCFDDKYPIVVFNKLETQSEKDEYTGFRQLLFAIGNICRNPRAHDPKIYSKDNLEDCLDLLTLISFVLKKLDICSVNQAFLIHHPHRLNK